MALYLFAANAPDLDFISGLLIGDPDLYHHGISHSIGFTILFGLIFTLLLFFLKKGANLRKYLIFLCPCGSHTVLDYLSKDTRFPYGIPFLWPVSNDYQTPLLLFF